MGNFQTVLKSLRKLNGLTQADLATALKISRSTIGMYESGSREPDFETMELIADYFNVDIDYLIGRTQKTTKIINTNENNAEDYKKAFAKNLRMYMELNGKTQVDLINDLGLNRSSISTWCKGTRLPRMDKVDVLANYFGIKRSDLIEDKSVEPEPTYYLNKETKEIAQEIFENKELRLLFDASKDASPEDLKLVHDMLLRMKRSENHNDEY